MFYHDPATVLPHWHTPVRIVITCLILWTVARYVLGYILSKFLNQHISIGRVSWLTLNDIEWCVIKHTRDNVPARIRSVHIDRIGLVVRSGGAKKDSRLGWWTGVAASGVRVELSLVPGREDGAEAKESIVGSATSSGASSSMSREPSASITLPAKPGFGTRILRTFLATAAVIHDLRRYIRSAILGALPRKYSTFTARSLRKLRHRTIAPFLHYLNIIGRRCNFITIFLAVEVSEITIIIPKAELEIKLGLLRVGGEIARGWSSHVAAWCRAEGFAVCTKPQSTQAVSSDSKTRKAFELPGPLLVEAKANFDPAIGMAGLFHRNAQYQLEARKAIIDLSISFPTLSANNLKASKIGKLPASVRIRTDIMLAIAQRIKESMEGQVRTSEPNSPSEHARIDSVDDDGDSKPVKKKQNQIAMLKSLRVCIPLIQIESRLLNARSSRRELYNVETRLRTFALEVVLGGVLTKGDKHVEWFGNQASLKASAKLGFEKIDIDLSKPPSSSAQSKPVRFMELSPTGVHVSSSWLPPRLSTLFAHGSSYADDHRAERLNNLQLAGDRNASRLVIEADIGGVSGEAGIELVDDMLHMVAHRRKDWQEASDIPALHKHKARKADETSSPKYIYDPPVLAVVMELGQCGFRIHGPQGQPHRTDFGPGEDDAELSPGWQAPSVLCLQIPSAAVHVISAYVDVCLQRTDAQRREARRMHERGKTAIPEALSSGTSERTRQRLSSSIPRSNKTDSRQATPFAEGDDPFLSSQSASQSPSPAFDSRKEDLSASTFMSPYQETQRMFNPPLSAHRGSEADLRNHPFVYRVKAGAICERVDFFLLSASDQLMNNRTNPTSAGPSRHYAAQPQQPKNNSKRQSMSAIQARHNISHVGPFHMAIELEFLGGEFHAPTSGDHEAFTTFLSTEARQGAVRIHLESVDGDISHFDVHHSLNGLISTLTGAKIDRRDLSSETVTGSQDTSVTDTPKPPTPLFKLLPLDMLLVISLADINIHLAGPDPLYNPSVCRGMAVQASSVTFEYYQQSSTVPSQVEPRIRALLGLVEDIRTHANAEHARQPSPRQAYCRLQIKETRFNPVKDAGQESRILKAKTAVDSGGTEATDAQEGIWEYKNRDKLAGSEKVDKVSGLVSDQRKVSHAFIKDFFWIPDVTIRTSLWAESNKNDSDDVEGTTDHIGIVVRAPMIIARIELFQVYCFLMAFSAVRALQPKRQSQGSRIPQNSRHKGPRVAPVIRFKGDIDETHIYLTLPHDVRLFGRFKRIQVSRENHVNTFRFEHALLAGASILSPGQWDDILRMRDWQVEIKNEPGNAGYHEHAIYVHGSGARLRVPFKYPFANIIDNTATFVKTVKQLRHQFIKGQYTSAIAIVAEEAKKTPQIEVALKILVLEAEDDPFETKLNLLCRVGKEEQKERLAREQAFADKVASIKRMNEDLAENAQDQEGGNGRRRPQLSVGDAYAILQSVHSQKWIKRHRNATLTKQRREEAQVRRLYGSIAAIRDDASFPIKLVKTLASAPLLRMVLENPVIKITKPSFADKPNGFTDYMADVGKGLPKDTKYSLLIPLHIDWQMSEGVVQIRDYPLPLLYIPPVQQAQSAAKSWHLSSDFVVAEEFGEPDSVRHVPAEIVPRSVSGREIPYVRSIPRSAMPVKTYALPTINISSTWATRMGWGNSIQPAIQDVMRVIDSLNKAPPDPSDRLGFWDKLRLILHWRIQINFLGDGPLHIILKGSRDPYSLAGPGAGFALCWRNNIRWKIGMPNPEKEFLQILSQDFVLGIPNLDDFRDAAATGVVKTQHLEGDGDDRSAHAPSGYSDAHQLARNNRNSQEFRKICAKFMGGVKWGSGIQLERTCTDETCDKCSGSVMERQCRFFDFKPHFEVKTISGNDASYAPNHDSFAGFRSNFIHFSVSVVANSDTSSENSIHLTPNGFTHFWSWWHLFDGTMSLPIRHGRLFPSIQPPSKKFGKHTATIKYRIQLAPVYIAHTYKQDNWQDWREGCTTVLGLKGRIESFNVDMHQREQEVRTWSEPLQTTRKRLHKAFHRAEIDCKDIDLRVLAAQFADANKAEVDLEEESEDADLAEILGLVDPPILPDEEMVWLDLDDFRDLNVFLPDENPRLRIIPCFKSPRLTYSRFSDAAEEHAEETASGGGDSKGKNDIAASKFGREPTHKCLLDQAAVAVDVQLESAEKRLNELREELRTSSAPSSHSSVADVEELKKRLQAAQNGADRIRNYRDRRNKARERDSVQRNSAPPHTAETLTENFDDPEYVAHYSIYDDLDDWINRLVIHNPNVVISQRIRDILMRYYYSSRQSRLSDYAMTSRAIKFIKELASGHKGESSSKEKEEYLRQRSATRRGASATFNRSTSSATQKPRNSEDLLEKLLNDEGVNWSFRDRGAASDAETESQASSDVFDLDPHTEAASNLSDRWGVRNSFLVSVLKPQVALNSDSHHASTVIVVARSIQLRIFGIVDEQHLDDPINASVMHRSFGTIDSLQAFYPHMHGWRTGKKESMLYSLQDFVPFEVFIGGADDTKDLDRIVPSTSARLRYDKHNRLRLSNDGTKHQPSHGVPVSKFRSTVDRLTVLVDRFSVSATPKHYAAIYDVVTNLVLHTDPEQKARSQKVESVVLSKDFSDREGIAGNVRSQQEELRNLREREVNWTQRGQSQLSDEEIMAAYETRVETIRKMDLLTLWMGALQTASDTKANTKSMGMQLDAKASEIVWHMRDAEEKPLIKVGVKGVAFRWLNRSDGNIANCLVIQDLTALNSSPEHSFSEIISKYPTPASANSQVMRSDLFVAVLWSMLAPVGGISIIDRFEVHLHPVKVQLEQKTGKQMQEYLFGQKVREEDDEDSSQRNRHNGKQSIPASNNERRLRPMKSVDSFQQARRSMDDYSMRSDDSSSMLGSNNASSSASFRSGATGLRQLRHAASSETLSHGIMKADDHLDADEMRERARLNRSFLHVEFFPTILCLSFKGDKATSLYDLYGLIYKSPTIIHCNRIWSYGELVDNIKRDFKSSIWSQSATLLGQILTTARKPRNTVNAVQQRLLGTSSDKEKQTNKKRRNIMSSFRSRGQADTEPQGEHQTSPLRSMVVQHDVSDNEGESDGDYLEEDSSFTSNGDVTPDNSTDYATQPSIDSRHD